MAVLVTGGAGYIGSHVVHALADAGEQVVVIDTLATGASAAIPERVPLFIGDAGDDNLIPGIVANHGVTALIHLAGSNNLAEARRDPLTCYRNNTMMTRAVLAAASRSGLRHIVLASSAAVYDAAVTTALTESAPTRPVSTYGTSKLMEEIMLHDAARACDLRFVTLRLFAVAGADPKGRTGLSSPRSAALMKAAAEAALGERAAIEVYGTDFPTPDGTAIRDYVHVSDVADAAVAALHYLQDAGPSVTLNCGNGRPHSVLDAIDAMRRAAGRNFPVRYAERNDDDAAILVADARRIVDTLDWRPAFPDIDAIARDALAWERRLKMARDDVRPIAASA